MGMGMVVRDHSGAFKFACSEGIAGIINPELAEATTVRRALVLAKEQGFRNIILASDCLTVIQKIAARVRDRSLVGSVVGDIRCLASEFSTCSFIHVGRQLNGAVHSLARSSEPGLCNVYCDVVPEHIRAVLCIDVP
jgi:ribonuclease HI